MAAAPTVAPAGVQAQSDPLPSWSDGASKKAVLDFVARTATAGSSDFVAVPIAAYAADSTATFRFTANPANMTACIGLAPQFERGNNLGCKWSAKLQ